MKEGKLSKETESIQNFVDEFKHWKESLRPYWKQIDKNSEMYEFYKRENSETQSEILLNTPFAIVESMVSKAKEATLSVTVNAKGEKGLNELEKWISAIVKNAMTDPDVAQFYGTFRKIREKFFRNFLVEGNAVASVEWCRKVDANGKVIANNPYVKVRNLKSVIFNPTKTLSDSDVYYLESWVKYSDLQKNEYDKKSEKGIYKNLGKLKEMANMKEVEIDDEVYYSNGQRIVKKGEPIRILERWEGAKYCVIADDSTIIREENDPFKIGGNNLLTAMNYVKGDRPYAYGEIDSIYMTVRAQDTIVNQSIDIVNRYLRPSILVDPMANANLDQLMDLIENGGVMEGKPEMIGAVPTNVPPTAAFTTIDTLQQAIERTERFSPYSTGVPNSAVDKTQGTATGIQSMQAATEPNFQIKLDALTECFVEPAARMELKMIANLMSPSDFRYAMLMGKTSEWVKAGKNVLMGKPTIKDLLAIGYTNKETAIEYTHTLVPSQEMDEMGQPLMDVIPIPGAEKAPVFDIDWLVSVDLDNQSAAIKEAKVNKLMGLIQFAQQLGVQVSPERTVIKVANVQGVDDFEDLLLNEEEQQQSQEQMMQQQQMEQQGQQEQMQAQQQSEQSKMQADMQKEQLRGQTAEKVAALRNAQRQTPSIAR